MLACRQEKDADRISVRTLCRILSHLLMLLLMVVMVMLDLVVMEVVVLGMVAVTRRMFICTGCTSIMLEMPLI